MSILTIQEAADALDYETPDDVPGKVMSIFVPAVDDFLTNATGKRWSEEPEINAQAKLVATILLVRMFENPGQIEKLSDITDKNLVALIAQLTAKARGG